MTTTAQLGTTWALLEAGLRQRRPVWIYYHGRQRLISPHALGWKGHRPMLLAYQHVHQTRTQGLTEGSERGWRNMFVDEVDHVVVADPPDTWETADNYNPSHPFNSVDHLSIAISFTDWPNRD